MWVFKILNRYIISMQVQNSNIEPQTIQQKLLCISDQIIQHSRSGREFKLKGNLTNSYTFVYDQCTSKPGKSQNMFVKYKEILTLHFINYIKAANIQYDEHVFKQTNKLWSAYIKFAKIISKQVFTYLDRYFTPSRDHGNLIDVAVAIFDKNVFGTEIKRKIYLDCFANSIKTMRKNMIITQNHLHDFIRQLYPINTQFYFQIKKTYVEQTRAFYEQKYKQLKQLQPLYFYNSIVNLIYFEQTLSNVCLFWTHEEMLKERIIMPIIFTKQLIEPYTSVLLNHPKGFNCALKQFHVPLLNIITDIYSKFEGFDKIKKFYYDYIVEESRQLIQTLQLIHQEEKIVGYITNFFNKHHIILTKGFKKHQQVQVTLSNALQFSVGKWDKLPEILFKFCEKVVANGNFDTDSSIIKTVFQKIGSKDQFIHKCEAWIQSIILNEKVSITQLHKFAIFLHDLCGSQNTNKLQKLVTDYIEQNHQKKGTNNFICKVISLHLWERRFKEEIAVCLSLPQVLQSTWTRHVNNYSLTDSKKKLQLLPLSSHVILQLKFDLHRLTVKCNLLQASILLSLEQNSKTEEELIQHINTEKHLITSFVTSAKFIVAKGEKLAIDWSSIEEGFKDYTQQFEQKSKFIKAIEQDRNILLEAGIVRMIKRRKQVSFEEIFDYLCHTIKLFRPLPHMVKTTIQKLIKRDFIETNEQGLYIYKQ